MRKLVESTFVTLDGVISDPQVWGSPYWDDEHAGYARKLLFAADAMLRGRVTYLRPGLAVAGREQRLRRPHQRAAQARGVAHPARRDLERDGHRG